VPAIEGGTPLSQDSGRALRGSTFRVSVRAAGALLALAICGCATAPAPAPPPLAAPAPVRVEPQRDWADAVLYFVVLDRFADGDRGNDVAVDTAAKGAFHGGDLAGLTAELDEIASLGVTALWLTPVVDNIDGFVTGAGFPDWGYHGYWADDFERIDPRFGTEAELARLVEAAHVRGLKVLLDVVYNHAGYGSRYLTEPRYSGWLRSTERGDCGQDDLTSCVSGLPDFRTERPEVAEYLLEAQLSLAERVALDGFRLDTVKHVDHPFWREHRRLTRQRLGEDFFLVGEVWGGDAASLDPWFAGDEMDAGFDFSFQGSVLGWLSGRGRTVAFDRYLQSRHGARAGHHLAHFLSSHDVAGALSLLGGDRDSFRLAALLQMTTVGIPTIYYGEEVGRPGGDWPDNRSDMPWAARDVRPGAGLPRDEALREDYRRLIALRRAHRALQTGSHRTLATAGDLLVFARELPDEAVVVAVNRGTAPTRARIARPTAWGARTVEEIWVPAAAVSAQEDWLEIEVAPRSARILTAVGAGAPGRSDG
jgi:alpha-amylase